MGHRQSSWVNGPPFFGAQPTDEVPMTPAETVASPIEESFATSPIDNSEDTPGDSHDLVEQRDSRIDVLANRSHAGSFTGSHVLHTNGPLSTDGGGSAAPIMTVPRRRNTRTGNLFSVDEHHHEEAQSGHPHLGEGHHHLEQMLHDVVEHMHESSSDTEEVASSQGHDACAGSGQVEKAVGSGHEAAH